MEEDRKGLFAGAAAATVSLGVSELIAGLVPAAGSLIVAIGSLVIDLQPAGAKDLVVSIFGEADKTALNVAIVVLAVLIAAALGRAAVRRFAVAAIGFAAAGGLGLFAALQDPLVSPALAAGTVAVSVVAGLATLWFLIHQAGTELPQTSQRAAALVSAERRPEIPAVPIGPRAGRRRFLLLTGSAVGLGLASMSLGRLLLTRQRPTPPPVAATLPLAPVEKVPPPPPGAGFDVAGLTPLIVPNEDFYRIDTNLLVPHLDPHQWRLRVHGMVHREVELSYEQLLAMPMVERYVTIACVSNEVGGGLVGNAKWTGVRLDDVLALAGVRPGATQIVGRAYDGWTAGFPTAFGGRDGREGLIAVHMNGVPLPPEHGFPARLIIPGLYGYVSATKWVTEIELTTLEAFDAYWVPLGWAKEAPILTQSRIDVPRDRSSVSAGRVPVAGVAWAPDRGIANVEVQIDDGPWTSAAFSVPLSEDTWVQWLYDWDAPPGDHTLKVRATDGTGEIQTAERTPPAPDGARGHHSISVTVV